MLTSIPNRVLPLFRSTALTAACEAHLQHLADRHYAETTCAVRRVHLRLFCTWAAAHGVTHAEWLTRAVREAYRHHLLECRKPDGAPLSLASQHARLTHLRVWSGGPRELDRKPGTLSGTLLGACYAALC